MNKYQVKYVADEHWDTVIISEETIEQAINKFRRIFPLNCKIDVVNEVERHENGI